MRRFGVVLLFGGIGLVLALTSRADAYAQTPTIVWQGTVSDSWQEPLNWDQLRIPGPADDVLIPEVLTARVAFSGTATVRSIDTSEPLHLLDGVLTLGEGSGTVVPRAPLVLGGGELAGATVAGGVINGTTGRLRAVTLADEVRVSMVTSLQIIDGLTVEGTMVVDALPRMEFEGVNVVRGPGEIDLRPATPTLLTLPSSSVEIAPDATVLFNRANLGHCRPAPCDAGHLTINGLVRQLGADPSSECYGSEVLGRVGATGRLEVDGGKVCVGGWGFRNEGALRAASGQLVIRGPGPPSTEDAYTTTDDIGTLEAGRGTVTLTGTIDNTGRTFAPAAGTNVSIEATFNGGVIEIADGDELMLHRFSQFLMGLTVHGNLRGSTYVRGPLHVDGTFRVDDLTIHRPQAVTGEATLHLEGHIRLDGLASETLVLESDVLVTGSGSIGCGSMCPMLVNRGRVVVASTDAARPRKITLGAPILRNEGAVRAEGFATLSLGGAWTNTGQIEIDGGVFQLGGDFRTADMGDLRCRAGQLHLYGHLHNRDARLTLTDACGSLTLFQNAKLTGGVVEATGSTTITLDKDGWATVEDTHLIGDVVVETSTHEFKAIGTVRIDGTMVVGADLTATHLVGNAEIRLVDGWEDADGILHAPWGGRLEIGAGVTITGRGSLGAKGPPWGFEVPDVVMHGAVRATSAADDIAVIGTHVELNGSVEVRDGGSVEVEGQWSSRGGMTLGDRGTLALGGSFTADNLERIDPSGGALRLGPYAEVDNVGGDIHLPKSFGEILGGGTFTGGRMVLERGASFVGVSTFADIDVVADFHLRGSYCCGNIPLTFDADSTWQGHATLDGAYVLNLKGAHTLAPETALTLQGGKVEAGALEVSSGASITGYGSVTALDGFSNHGTVAVRDARPYSSPGIGIITNRFYNGGLIDVPSGGRMYVGHGGAENATATLGDSSSLVLPAMSALAVPTNNAAVASVRFTHEVEFGGTVSLTPSPYHFRGCFTSIPMYTDKGYSGAFSSIDGLHLPDGRELAWESTPTHQRVVVATVPTLTIADISVQEPATGQKPGRFIVRASDSWREPMSVSYGTQDRTATAGSDYGASSGTATLSPCQTTATIDVSILADAAVENDETFVLSLSDAVGARLARTSAMGTITDTAAAPSPSASPTPSPSASPTPSPSASPTPSPSASPTPTPSASPTPSPSASPTPGPSAPPEAPRVTRLDMTSSPAVVVGRTPAELRARLTDATTGTGVPGRTVVLEGRYATGNGAFQPVAKGITSDAASAQAGRVTLEHSPRRHWEYRVRFNGVPQYDASRSTIVLVRFRPAIRAALSSSHVEAGTLVRIVGTVQPGSSTDRVALQRRVDGMWRTLQRRDQSLTRAGNGRVVFEVRPRSAGRVDYRIRVPWVRSVHLGAADGFSIKAS